MTQSPARTRPTRWRRVPPTLALVAICLSPHLTRLEVASLYADDVVRIGQLQTTRLDGMLFAPFNEHMAPLFQVVSRVTWQLAGRSLLRAPLAFTVASYVPFLLALGFLGVLLRRETRSAATAMAGVAVFSLSWLSLETIYWYSASSFMWSLAAALAAWTAAAASAEGFLTVRRRRAAAVVAAIASAASPAFSAVGLLAGLLASLRMATATGGVPTGRTDRSRAFALWPLAGTLAYLAVCSAFRLQDALTSNLKQKADIGLGLLAAARAPVDVMLPALLGLKPVSARGVPAVALELAANAAVVVWLLNRSRRRADDRPLILGGLFLIFGGYALTCCGRAGTTGVDVLGVQRYHLFPMCGLVLVLAPFLRQFLARWETRPSRGVWVSAALAAVLFATHRDEIRYRALFFRHPDQLTTLAAVEHLGEVCARAGVSRERVIAALDPVVNRWTEAATNALTMLPPDPDPVANGPGPPGALLKAELLAALTPDERRAVCGGMDASPYLRPFADHETTLALGRPVLYYRVREVGSGRLVSSGWPSFVEYDWDGPFAPDARALGLPSCGDGPSGVVEVWWRGDHGPWSETRSVRVQTPDGRGWVLPFDRLPHWDPSEVRRLRLLFHRAGRVALGAPRLVR